MLDEDLDLKTRIADVFECAAKEVIALVETDRDVEKSSPEPLPEWLTAAQLARYWQLINANGEPITAGIMKWTKRAENEHPLPHACMGDLLRFKRETSIGGRRKKLRFAELRRTERNCISRVNTVTGFKLLIEWQRSLKDGCHSSKGELNGSLEALQRKARQGRRAKGQGHLDRRVQT